jgi:DNA-directed RNA polymerase specialized sigma24 family protein
VRLAERHSQRQLADFLGVSHATVNRRLKLARTALAPAAEPVLNGSGPHAS